MLKSSFNERGMPMNGELAALALKALDGLSLRAEATAQNIANAGTPGYRPLAVSFEKALADAAGLGSDAVAAFRPRVAQAKALFGSDALRLDLELQTATATASRYAAIVEVLKREVQLQTLGLTGGR
jgi:flagellar basal-body rod protein FlgB